MRQLLALSLSLLFALAAGPGLSAQGGARGAPWDARVVELFESLPVQDGGRVKPLHTYAGFTLLRFQGKRSIKTPGGERLTPVEWLLDTLFFPAASATYPTFLVQNDEVLTGIGLEHAGRKKRDRYSFDELRPAIPRLFALAREYGAIEEKERSTVQQQTFLLADNVHAYSTLLSNLDFAREPIVLPPSEDLERIFPGRTEVSFAEVLEHMPELSALYRRLSASPGDDMQPARAVGGALQQAFDLVSGTESLALFPPVGTVDPKAAWSTPSEAFQHAFDHGSVPEEHQRLVAMLTRLANETDAPEAFRTDAEELHRSVVGMAQRADQYDGVELELAYYKSKVLDYSQMLFVLGFLLTAFLWLRPRTKWLYAGASSVVLAATLVLCAAIVMRCIIRGRPPVSTLYESVLFVTATGALVALFIELISRRRIAISAAAIVGVVGLFIANGYETLDKRDTMPSLVAVLDTNFWLATHVTAITIGYSAGMLAALLASVYLIVRLFGWKRGNDRRFQRDLARMVYGVLCFAVIFSLVGTILGGIWANDSWGRFWGWDPKENGALLIVISQLVILHGRMGGYLREHGLCMAAAFGGTVIAFSWWGVNLLGVGLHSYGFTSGIHQALWGYYGFQWLIVGLGGVAWFLERSRSAVKAERKSVAAKPLPQMALRSRRASS